MFGHSPSLPRRVPPSWWKFESKLGWSLAYELSWVEFDKWVSQIDEVNTTAKGRGKIENYRASMFEARKGIQWSLWIFQPSKF